MPAELCDAIDVEYKQEGFKSQREYIQDALENAVDHRYKSKAATGFELEFVECRSNCINPHCKRENKHIEEFEFAWRHPRHGFMCNECYALRYGGKALAEMERKRLRKKEAVHVLDEMLKARNGELNLNETDAQIQEAIRRWNLLRMKLEGWIGSQAGSTKERQAIEDSIDYNEKLRKYCLEMEAWMAERIPPKDIRKKKKKRRQSQYA